MNTLIKHKTYGYTYTIEGVECIGSTKIKLLDTILAYININKG